MEIKIKLNGRKLVACKGCGVYKKMQGKRKKKGFCKDCTPQATTV